MEVDLLTNISDEEYVIERAKKALENDPLSAKAWMITAKTLYPNNFGVQFEAYCIEKSAGNVKEAAKYFSDLIGKFKQHTVLWKEIENLTTALRSENNTNDPEKQFLCEMFKHISLDVQHQLLLFTADHCEDTMEHCTLLLLLLQKFPTAIPSHGPGLVDTLLSAEKHSHASNQPVNAYRRLLICDLLPLLGTSDVNMELSPKLLFKLLHKAIEFYLCYVGMSPTIIQDGDLKIDEPWIKLFSALEFIGRHLNWERYLCSFGPNWTKEGYWQKILSFCQSKTINLEDVNNIKQLVYCLTLFFLHCLHEYMLSLFPESGPGQIQTPFVLVEAFTDLSLPNPVVESKSKRRKGDADISVPYLTVEKNKNKTITSNFLMAVNCWDLLNSSEVLQREFGKLNAHLKLDMWLNGFLIDYAIYKGCYDDALNRLKQLNDGNHLLSKNLRIASILYIKKNYSSCFEHILQIIPTLPGNNCGSLSTSLIVGGNQRHLHYLPITQTNVLQYCVKILLRSIKENMLKHSGSYNELAIGNILVLTQLDWPQEEDVIPPLMEYIQQRGSFQYHLFQNYVINVDILEELTYLWTNQGGQITLDIIPHLGQRRIGTRGADKGVKEEIRQAIRRQITRCNEPLYDLILKFITQERVHIVQCLI